VLGVLLPLLVGMAIRMRYPDRARPWASALGRVSALGFVAVVAVAVARDIGELAEAASEVWIVAAVTASAALLLGWSVGYPGRDARATAALVTSVRANAPAPAVASGAYGLTSEAASAIVAFAIASLLIAGVVAVPLARARPRG
jgi:predicted Na+-dependent transporter